MDELREQRLPLQIGRKAEVVHQVAHDPAHAGLRLRGLMADMLATKRWRDSLVYESVREVAEPVWPHDADGEPASGSWPGDDDAQGWALDVLNLPESTVLVIGVGQPQRSGMVVRGAGDPTAGTIAGHAMASVFHDTLQADVEQAQRVSQTLSRLPPELATALPYTPLEVLALQPSFSLDELARKHIGSLPAPTRNTLTGLGALDTGRSSAGSAAALASYLLFEPDFVHALIELGEHDAWRRKDELLAFFGATQTVGASLAMP